MSAPYVIKFLFLESRQYLHLSQPHDVSYMQVLQTLVSDLDYIDLAMVREEKVTSLVQCNESEDRLRRTTRATKSYFSHFIENEQWYGIANITKGFEYAFDLLEQPGPETCHKLIVLFTDYTNEKLIPYIEKRDKELGGGTHVVIFTYGFEGWIRQNLSRVAEHFEGYSVKIKNLPHIFTAARRITNVFTSKGVREALPQFPFSNSYKDGFGIHRDVIAACSEFWTTFPDIS
eukprot:sb/3469389/